MLAPPLNNDGAEVPDPSSPAPRRRWWAAAAAALVVLAGVVVGVDPWGGLDCADPGGGLDAVDRGGGLDGVDPWGGVDGTRSAAAEVLLTTAEVAEMQPELPEDGIGYLRAEVAYAETWGGYAETSVVGDDGVRTFTYLVRRMTEVWVRPDGSGRMCSTAGEIEFLGKDDREDWEAVGRPPLAEAVNSDFEPGEYTFGIEDLESLSTDPDELRRQLLERNGEGDDQLFVAVGGLLREMTAPPALRAALYRVAADIEGIEVISDYVDRAGRHGTAVALTSDDNGPLSRNVLIFDPATSQLLGEEEVLLERVDWVEAEPPVTRGWTTYLESQVVAAIP